MIRQNIQIYIHTHSDLRIPKTFMMLALSYLRICKPRVIKQWRSVGRVVAKFCTAQRVNFQKSRLKLHLTRKAPQCCKTSPKLSKVARLWWCIRTLVCFPGLSLQRSLVFIWRSPKASLLHFTFQSNSHLVLSLSQLFSPIEGHEQFPRQLSCTFPRWWP